MSRKKPFPAAKLRDFSKATGIVRMPSHSMPLISTQLTLPLRRYSRLGGCRFNLFTPVLFLMMYMCGSANAQSWINQSPMKKPRSESSAISYNGQVFVFNGFAPNIRIENTVEQYNPSNGSWNIVSTTSTGLGNAVTHNGIVRVGNEAWLIGGRIGNHPGPVTDSVWIFNLDTHNWRRGPELPIPGAGGGAALVNNRIHWFGGLDTQARCDVPNHFVYNLQNPSAGWQNITAVAGMPSPRNHFSTIELGGKIYAIGGQFGHDACPGAAAVDTNLVHVFNPQNNQWNRLANIPIAQSHAEPSTFVQGNSIYLVGGERQGDRVYRYDVGSNNWQQVLNLPERLLAPVARMINGRLVVAGGGAPTTAVPVTTVRSRAISGNAGPPSPAVLTPQQPQPELQPEPQLPADFQPLIISFEAESFSNSSSTDTHQWQNVSVAGASGSSFATLPDDGLISEQESSSPSLQYLLNFERSGTFYVWVRGLGDAEGKSNSLHIGLNGEIQSSADQLEGFNTDWRWSNQTRDGSRATLQISQSGVHNISLWMREDGLVVDKIVITNDPRFQPTGLGPAVSDGTLDDGSVTFDAAADTTQNNVGGSANSTISVNNQVISWPDNGWYQVLNANDFTEVCGGGSQCSVSTGTYVVINHSSGERFENIVVQGGGSATSAASMASAVNTQAGERPFVIDGNVIRFTGTAWYQVQNAQSLQSICNGLFECEVSNGEYIVIDHSNSIRFNGVLVGGSATAAQPAAGPLSVENGLISWVGNDWYQVLRLPGFVAVCEGREFCQVEPGNYVVVNLTTSERFEGIEVR